MASSKLSAEQTSRKGSKSPSRQKHDKPTDYRSEGVKNNDIFELPGSDWQLLGVLTVLAAIVRLFRIYQPPSVVFDEVHFGGFATKYIKGKFFMDVHPPLAKMLIAAFGWLAGFKGDFDFKDIGMDYLEPGVPYVSMRLFPAICGVLTIPTMFLSLKAFGARTMSAALGAGLVIFGAFAIPYCTLARLMRCREWPINEQSTDPSRLASYNDHCFHGTRFCLLF